MYNITLKYLQEIDSKKQEVDNWNFMIDIKDAKDILERFEVELRQELERRYLGQDVKQEIHY